MSHYVIGDIHACYDDLMKMIRKIKLKDTDKLYMVGDYIDRGDQNVAMMEWLYNRPANVTPVRGNHDENFAYYIDLMNSVETNTGRHISEDSCDDACLLYALTRELLLESDPVGARYFDMYGTICKILLEDKVTMRDLRKWAAMFRSFPIYYRLDGVARMDRPCIIVHAGYRDDLTDDEERLSFFLEARRPAYTVGGMWNGMVIAGHTPTIIDGEFTYSPKGVFRYEDRLKNCIFYDIDCGCVFRSMHRGAKLACLRIEDEKTYYV